ncbi:MAG: hypothetical protein LPD71_12915 [Shewanella sp.]|nr:hypothetical protein [Shewanella sp.]MCF1429487.1 hypothetical protein [Shewanella sp.]MCF1439598.1 hypothetical protein [Shewanella sp.]MCF1457670.1 hypothetical protein [Shewanella sp.]
MKTRINLLSADILPPTLLITFDRVVLLSVLIILVGGFGNLWYYRQNSELQGQLSALQQDNIQLKNEAKQLEQLITNRSPDHELAAQVNDIGERLLLKQQLLAQVVRYSDTSRKGFSGLLTDLANVEAPKLWLTSIEAGNQRFDFEGYSIQAHTVPSWIELLKTTQSLKGYAFSAMSMEMGEEQLIGFVLSGQPEEKPAVNSKGAK